MAFAEELVKNRKVYGFTQETLAEKCDVSRQAVAKWEKGESLPDVYTIAKLANLFEISIEDLIWSKEEICLKNKLYYVQEMSEKDRRGFSELIREHKWFGEILKSIDSLVEKTEPSHADEEIWETFTTEGKAYSINSVDSQKMVGYFYVEAAETSGPSVTFQLKKEIGFNKYMVELTRNFFNMLYREYKMRAMQVMVNSELEREIFLAMGFENVKDQVMVVLPI